MKTKFWIVFKSITGSGLIITGVSNSIIKYSPILAVASWLIGMLAILSLESDFFEGDIFKDWLIKINRGKNDKVSILQ